MNTSQIILSYQPMLQQLAYKIVACKEDAEDIVQETLLKWLALDKEKIENTKAYLIKAVTNNCLKHLQVLKTQKRAYLDSVAEVVHRFKETNLSSLDLDTHIHHALGVIVVHLKPVEQAVFLLKEIFGYDYESLQEILNKKKAHCRQLFCRAKKKITSAANQGRLPDTSRIAAKFKVACELGSITALLSYLESAT